MGSTVPCCMRRQTTERRASYGCNHSQDKKGPEATETHGAATSRNSQAKQPPGHTHSAAVRTTPKHLKQRRSATCTTMKPQSTASDLGGLSLAHVDVAHVT
jgi:hypothetical protein